jgi:alpha-2-macroglobulin-like protein
VDGAATSITRSGGDALKIETTALAVLAWLREPAYTAAAENGIRFLAESCKAGRFGSTQSTILALRAIVDYDKSRARPKAPGQLQVYVDGQAVGEVVAFDAATQGAIALPDISGQLGPGRYNVEIRMTDGSPMPYALTVNCYDVLPPSSDECQLTLDVRMGHDRLAEGEVTEVQVEVVNRGTEAAPTPVAIIGLPGGLEPRHDQLKELVRAGRIDAYEVIGREVVCYWRQLKPGQRAAFPISLVAAVPGMYTGPASRAYLYYTDEHKTWVPGAGIAITPRPE